MGVAKRKLIAGIAVLLVLAGAAVLLMVRPREQPVGLFTTLPILWAESATIADMLKSRPRAHWAKAALEARGGIVAVDSLAGLRGFDVLLMAQPRPLSPQENVALDDWVRGGGRLLLFADPMLTAPSAFALGDRRRPQDVVLISPILGRWGLQLSFDDGQAYGLREVAVLDMTLPVNLPGRFTLTAKHCTLGGEGLVAECRVGKGHVLALADAALFESSDTGEDDLARAQRLHLLLDRLAKAH